MSLLTSHLPVNLIYPKDSVCRYVMVLAEQDSHKISQEESYHHFTGKTVLATQIRVLAFTGKHANCLFLLIFTFCYLLFSHGTRAKVLQVLLLSVLPVNCSLELYAPLSVTHQGYTCTAFPCHFSDPWEKIMQPVSLLVSHCKQSCLRSSLSGFLLAW